VELVEQIAQRLTEGDEVAVAAAVRQALDAGLPAARILTDGLLAGMSEISRRFKAHEIYLPDVLLAAQAMQAGMELLKPHLIGKAVPSRGKVVLGTVQGDLHDIGKNLVGIMLRGAGYEVIDLGHDVPPQKFIETAVAEQAPVIGLSALLTTTMPVMKTVVDLVRQQGLAGKVRVIVGGAPVSENFARQIGADAYGYDAANAVERVNELLLTA
jgi:5-methyltetrahydrofolate--homocysteine methyltransferase